MPVRSLTGSVIKWPDASTVHEAARRWAAGLRERVPGIHRIGYIGSYARGDWGVGSDLDVIVVMEPAEYVPAAQRGRQWDLSSLPVAVDLQVYTRTEWDALLRRRTRFARTVRNEAVWVG